MEEKKQDQLHHHHVDSTDSLDDQEKKDKVIMKQGVRAARKRNALILFTVLCFLAFSMMAFVVFIYLND